MEISLISTNPRPYFCSSTESLLFKRVKLPSWNSRTSQPLLGRPCSLFHKENLLKVKCIQKREIPVLEASSMDEVFDTLAERTLPTSAEASNPNAKHIVGLAGPPGSGKSTLAVEVTQRVNKLWPQKARSFDSQVKPPNVAIVIPMDGFHLYRSQLDAMENPEEAHARRGAPWTFDPMLLLSCLKNLRNQGSVYAPSFDHGIGDPIEDDIFVSLQHKVVIVEGNYLLFEGGVWKEISSMFDEKWFIDVDLDTAMQRVLRRHIATGKHPDVAQWRIDYNDRPNAELIMPSSKNADLVIKSIDFQR
ncbi:putative uridine kinase C227.14 isoform X2 [Durio zibethinus]|uniref:Uridine kinase C227.14 isoform X1 n=1 Tax=Durio zibethinus TaxID=66656 RepID=A0A6P6A0S7_DURZI|nr:putative uridine kinase C227.14 isoform X1 [Durio zibethinus]XP_022758331.1 putative uridine kinase C227.14 isoform X2 [Durio zibethinus]